MITTEKLAKAFYGQQYKNGYPSVVVFTEREWLGLRKSNLCEFTDDEMKAALNNCGLIRHGWVFGCGGEVDMYVSLRFPTLVTADERI